MTSLTIIQTIDPPSAAAHQNEQLHLGGAPSRVTGLQNRVTMHDQKDRSLVREARPLLSATSPQRPALPAVAGRDVAACVTLGLLLPGIVGVAWMFGMHALGAGISLIMCCAPVCAVLGAAGLGWFLLAHKGWSLRELGFVKPRRSLWHLVWEVPVLMITAVLIAASIGSALGLSHGGSRATGDGMSLAPAVVASMIAVDVLLMPVVEEVIFRRVLFGWVSRALPVPVAVIATGAIFGACHVAPSLMLYAIPGGIGLTALRVWHDSLWASWIAHTVNNVLVSIAVFAVVT